MQRPPPPRPAPLDERAPEGLRGRGASDNIGNRFEPLWHAGADDPDALADDDRATLPGPATRFFTDRTRTILAHNDSPDIGFDTSFNPYRGCEHGCIYCYARPSHEFLGWSAGVDFESRILVKSEAPRLLRAELSAASWRPRVIAASGVTDCYQPIERALKLTRGCLAVLAELGNPVSVITKNALVVRDADVLGTLARTGAAAVTISLTTLDQALASRLEPRASAPAARLEAVRALARAGIPVGVNLAPIIPGLTDREIPALIEHAAAAGARWAGFSLLRLPSSVAPLFVRWLAQTQSAAAAARVLAAIGDTRGGALSDARFHARQIGEGARAESLLQMAEVWRRRHGLAEGPPALSTAGFRPPGGRQLSIFSA